MKTTLRALVLLSALAATSAGCAGLTDVLAAGVPTAIPSVGASTAPNANSNSNSNTTATTTPKPSSTPAAATGAAACTREKADSDKDNGTAKLGAYNNQYLPLGWVAAYNSEAQVTAAIDNIKDADWDCFQKFYPGATTVYLSKSSVSK